MYGGLNFPNLKLYFWSSVLRPVSVWFEPVVRVSWKPIKENLAQPHRLQDLIFSALPVKRAKCQLGPIMSFLLSTWRVVKKHCQFSKVAHPQPPF